MQTRALLLDSFRMMVARKLFWVTLAISALVVVVYGSIGSNERGLSMLFGAFTFEMDALANDSAAYRSLVQLIFANFLVPIWLAWIATILALVSTTSVFPDFQRDGAIDLVLSKPISRWKIFFVKYLGSLIFVFLQVSLFCLGVFLVVGLRLGNWNWTILAGIPVVMVFYSYLYSVNALLGITTRSAIAALLFTILFWFVLFIVQSSEGMFNTFRTQTETQLTWTSQRIERMERDLDRLERPQSIGQAFRGAFRDPEALRERLEGDRERQDQLENTLESLERWHGRSRAVLAVLPKTQETIGLLDRWIRADTGASIDDIFFQASRGSMNNASQRAPAPSANDETGDVADEVQPDPDEAVMNENDLIEDPPRFHRDPEQQREAQRRLREDYDARSPWFIIGTSLGFEAVVLLIAGAIFVRRDY